MPLSTRFGLKAKYLEITDVHRRSNSTSLSEKVSAVRSMLRGVFSQSEVENRFIPQPFLLFRTELLEQSACVKFCIAISAVSPFFISTSFIFFSLSILDQRRLLRTGLRSRSFMFSFCCCFVEAYDCIAGEKKRKKKLLGVAICAPRPLRVWLLFLDRVNSYHPSGVFLRRESSPLVPFSPK